MRLKKLLVGLGLVPFLAVAWAGYVLMAYPKAGPADASLRVAVTPARVAHGRYLVLHVAECLTCHSSRDWTRFGGPVIPASRFAGGEGIFDHRLGLPGHFYPGNLTPFGLARYSDGELVRALRCGVTKEGRPMTPRMPYRNYRQLGQEDLYSIIAYLRTLQPIVKIAPRDRPDWSYALRLRLQPSEAGPIPTAPDPSDPVQRGRYLLTMARCDTCHTPADANGHPVPGMYLAGGSPFPVLDLTKPGLPALPGVRVRSANLTPDPATSVGQWTQADFVAYFAAWRGKDGWARAQKVANGGFNSMMPWLEYADMRDKDLGDIYAYLRSVTPVRNEVVKFEAPTP
jgi:mono/diheme cytochrome c family protein